jgi:hypothetical protein
VLKVCLLQVFDGHVSIVRRRGETCSVTTANKYKLVSWKGLSSSGSSVTADCSVTDAYPSSVINLLLSLVIKSIIKLLQSVTSKARMEWLNVVSCSISNTALSFFSRFAGMVRLHLTTADGEVDFWPDAGVDDEPAAVSGANGEPVTDVLAPAMVLVNVVCVVSIYLPVNWCPSQV